MSTVDVLALVSIGWAGGVATACAVVVVMLPPRSVFRGSTTPTYPRPAAPQPPAVTQRRHA